jgi:hypothetical protein
MNRLKALSRRAFHALAVMAAVLPVWAQQAGTLEGLGLRGGSGIPSFGRVVVVLLAMVALAGAAALALRRFWPPAAQQTNGAIRIRAQLSLSSNLKLHVVDAGQTTLVVAEGRSGVAVAELAAPVATGRASGAGDAH